MRRGRARWPVAGGQSRLGRALVVCPTPDTRYPSAEEALAQLALDAEAWRPLRVEAVDRQANGPGAQSAFVKGSILALERDDRPD